MTRIVIVLPLRKGSEIADVRSYAPVGVLGAVYVHNVIGLNVVPSDEYWHTGFNGVGPFINYRGS